MDNCRALEVPKRTPSRFGSFVRMVVPSATVFFTGGCLMILVLAASRLVARSVGSSLYTWTSIVGVVLTGVAIGNYLGGRIADRFHARRALAVLFGLSSAACIGIVATNNVTGDWMGLWRLSWPSHVFLHVAIVLLAPTTLLGAVSPVAAKMALDYGLATGRTIGSIYAWSAAGAIAGTFLAGFVLIVSFGNAATIWLVGTAMLVMAVLYWVSCWVTYLWGMVFIALLTMGMSGEPWAQEAGTAALLRARPDPNVVYEAETLSGHVAVRRVAKRPDTRTFVQDRLIRSEMAVHDATYLPYFYLKVYAGLTRGLSENKKSPSMLVLGAGGYAFPRHLRAAWPNSRIEVVEIDPGVTKAATEAFGLDRGTTIETIHMEARGYVDQLLRSGPAAKMPRRYDFIYGDTLDDYAVPSQLLTKEFNDKIAGLLTDDGIYMIHLLDTCESGRLLGPVVNTLRETFPHVYVIAGQTGQLSHRDTSVVVAARGEIDPQAILAEHGKHLEFSVLDESQIGDLKDRCGGVILTDDYAPAENLLTPVVKRSATEILARKCFDKARELQSGNRYEPSIEWYHQAMDVDPSLEVEAYKQIGLMYTAWNKPEKAMEAFRNAIQAHEEAGGRGTAMGSVHRSLGTLLGRADRQNEGKEQLVQAVEAFRVELEENPNSVVAWEQLGDTSAVLGDFNAASDAFEKALALEPRTPSHYQKLARALELQRRYDEAVAVVRKHIDLVQKQGRRDLVPQLTQYMEVLKYNKVKQAK
jgi:tetratricopeptide (TPR) repeat protein/MFS family permease